LLRPRASGASAIFATDADARAYIAAVNAADGQPLEQATQLAINDFIVGCKADGIWSAIRASCILMGARTLSGALTPLVGAAPTNSNFVSADYNRKTGLVGNGSSKYLDSNRASNADPQNSYHLSVYIAATTGAGLYIGEYEPSANLNLLERFQTFHTSYVRTNSFLGAGAAAAGFFGAARTASNAWNARNLGANYLSTSSSVAPASRNVTVFAGNSSSGVVGFVSARISFYSIGESLTLSSLESRVTALAGDIGYTIDNPTANVTALHPEARDWVRRVYANGGTVSATTAAAVNTFCNSIAAESGLRAAILRLNLFCGNSDASLNAVRTPLYLSGSFGGATIGNATDTNVNFVAGDYQETGSGGGLKGNGSNKHLDTGFLYSSIPSAASSHMSFSGTSLETTGERMAVGQFIFPGDSAGLPQLNALDIFSTGANGRGYRSSSVGSAMVATPGTTSEAHMLGARTSSSLNTLYRTGVSAATGTAAASLTTVARAFFVFAGNNNGTPSSHTAARLRMYSIGNGLTDAQALAFSNAVIAFNTALGRA
jgi:hypothetical protein